ncbi:unnamed protein product [Brassicogethes aeneus]|uniref:DUF4371 domain-containing protein n=1 Tax=Brassicogethes aeneus TaxID=1431903 RepID=A0A9P0BF22_BRAAE|nr:unnamed protein product [Brassicogethes aeneus]
MSAKKRTISDFFKTKPSTNYSLEFSEVTETDETVGDAVAANAAGDCKNDNIGEASCSYPKKRKTQGQFLEDEVDDTVHDVSTLRLDTVHNSDADDNPMALTDLVQSLDEPPRQPALLSFPKTRFFSKQCTGASKTFISEGYKNWKRATETKAGFKYHNNSFQHKSAMVAWQSFKSTKNQQSVASQISTAHTKLIQQNREYIKSIVRCIIYLSTQGLALRGHDESTTTGQNRGNFLELLDLISRDNKIIAKRLLEGPKNAKYTQHSIQNELIHCLAELTNKHISNEVKEAPYFALMADETKDPSKTEQLSIIVRYYLNGVLYERFLGYEAADKLDASSLFQFIRKRLSECEIDISCCVAQTYNGANVYEKKG